MTNDLVKRLRYLGDHASYEPHMHHVAADLIVRLRLTVSYLFFAAAAELVLICLLMGAMP